MTHLRPLFLALGLVLAFQGFGQTALLDKDRSLPCLRREFVIVGHLTRDSLGTVVGTPELLDSSVEVLNEWFAPICVSFQLTQVDTIDNFQYTSPANYNELEQMWVSHHAVNRINVYLVSSLSRINGECTFAAREGILETAREGVFVQVDCLLEDPRWLVHGFGHYAGLRRTNADPGAERVNGGNCATAGDRICDTPADPFDPGSLQYTVEDFIDPANCRFVFLGQDADGHYYQPQTGNIMSQYPTHCWCGFTYDQYARMAEFMALSTLW